jgi:hypothetical protein
MTRPVRHEHWIVSDPTQGSVTLSEKPRSTLRRWAEDEREEPG